MKTRVLILGKGFVGSHMNHLPEHYEIMSVSKASHNYDQPDSLLNLLKTYKPDMLLNACGYTGSPNVDACESDKQKCWELNVNLPVTVATMCKTLDIPYIHVSSGCIYTGYDKDYTEQDEPNFGLSSEDSSWYSKTKHACEIALKKSDAYILRIRMPFCHANHERNFLNKVLKYDNLIDYKNSMTSIEDFVIFTGKFLDRIKNELNTLPWNRGIKPGIYNVCNPGGASIKDVVEIFTETGITNSNWNFVDISKLDLKANRSNCVLDCSKIENLGLNLPPVKESLTKSIQNLCKSLTFKTGLQSPKGGLEWLIK